MPSSSGSLSAIALTVPSRLVSQFADLNRVHVLDAPREPGAVQFYAVWHPRVDKDPSHSWLRQVVRTVVGSAHGAASKEGLRFGWKSVDNQY